MYHTSLAQAAINNKEKKVMKASRIINLVVAILNLICFIWFAIQGILNHDAYQMSVACVDVILGLYFLEKADKR